MLFKTVKNLFSSRKNVKDDEKRIESQISADVLRERGDIRAAIAAYRAHLKKYPFDVDVLNNLGCCLIDVGEHDAAGEQFELAFSLDDTFRPALVNYARHLQLQKKSDESMRYLRIAKIYNHEDASVNTIMSSMALLYGDGNMSLEYGLRAWLGQFDELRAANCFLFNSTYADVDEMRIAAEHRFWAETLKPLPAVSFASSGLGVELDRHFQYVDLPPKGERIRLAYWSPDFRNHSVRYFFLPLLEGHDREKFEIIGYYDLADKDEMTERIAAQCDHFMWVNEMPDASLMEMIRSHDIDVLVELSGHSSANRLDLLRARLARRQITGIGYPPTTGLSTIDAKVVDRHVVHEESAQYFTEFPLALEHSFWCFDPLADRPINPEPPVVRNGYITFGCFGNIGKITQRMLSSWREIMMRLPTCRIVVRSISFNDVGALREFRKTIERMEIDTARMELLGPLGYEALLDAYNDIDVVLDTFPFNGGTTSCFCTYMGVPIVSLVGKSLTGRMGLSMLSNLGLQDWAAHSFEEYVDKAVQHAGNIRALSEFRINARNLYKTTSLGNGKLFAADFEAACIRLLQMPDGYYQHQVPVLPGDELVRRAIEVMSCGNFEGAERIIDYCINTYPKHGHAQVIWTYRLTAQGKFSDAISHLRGVLDEADKEHHFILLLNIVRFALLAEDYSCLNSSVNELLALSLVSEKEVAYQKLCRICLDLTEKGGDDIVASKGISREWPHRHLSKLCVIVVGDDEDRYEKNVHDLTVMAQSYSGLSVSFFSCKEDSKCLSYKRLLQQQNFDVFVIVNQSIDVFGVSFYADITACLADHDLVSFGGVKKWDRLDWRKSPNGNKAISYIFPSGERVGFYEINQLGLFMDEIVPRMSLLDGRLLAIKSSAVKQINLDTALDPMLEGGGCLVEEYLSYAAFLSNLSLVVHQNLGVIADWARGMKTERIQDARSHLTEKMAFDPFMEDGEDKTGISISLPSRQMAFDVMNIFLN